MSAATTLLIRRVGSCAVRVRGGGGGGRGAGARVRGGDVLEQPRVRDVQRPAHPGRDRALNLTNLRRPQHCGVRGCAVTCGFVPRDALLIHIPHKAVVQENGIVPASIGQE